MKTTVSIARCSGYQEDLVYQQVKTAIDLLGGIQQFISPGEKVLLKPNLLIGRPPEKCVTTHPLVVKAAVRLVREAGAVPVIGDSPQLDSAQKACDKCGIGAVARDLSVQIVEFEPLDLSNPEGRVFKNFTLGKAVKDVDKIINLPKLKTHALTTLTLSVKNMFGCVPGARKGQWHVRTHTAGKDYFARMLLDLFYFVKPALNIVDGIIAMEGQGPGFGDPRHLGLIIAGSDGVAVDRVIAEIVKIPIEQVPVLQVALQDGYGIARLEDIAVCGEHIAEVMFADFKAPQYRDIMAKIPGPVMLLLKSFLTAQPTVTREECVECEMCLRACPRECITHPAGAILINEEACIQCLCCMEICPQGAIALRPGALLALFSGIRKFLGKK